MKIHFEFTFVKKTWWLFDRINFWFKLRGCFWYQKSQFCALNSSFVQSFAFNFLMHLGSLFSYRIFFRFLFFSQFFMIQMSSEIFYQNFSTAPSWRHLGATHQKALFITKERFRSKVKNPHRNNKYFVQLYNLFI